MRRPGIEPPGPVRWTAEELVESYAELAAIGAVRRPTDDATVPEGDTLELVATVEGREEPGRVRAESRASKPAKDTGSADAETYAVAPELDLLTSMLATFGAGAPRDHFDEEPAPATRSDPE